MTLLYVGAFNDPVPLVLFPDIDTFVYVDQAPSDQLDHWGQDCIGAFESQNLNVFVSFILNNLRNTGHRLGEIRIDNSQNYLKIKLIKDARVKTVHYFYNTVFPEVCPDLLQSFLSQITHWYICGYTPDFEFQQGQFGFNLFQSETLPAKRKNYWSPLSQLINITASDNCSRDLPKFGTTIKIKTLDENDIIDPIKDLYIEHATDADQLPSAIVEIMKHVPTRFSPRFPTWFRLPIDLCVVKA